MHVFIEGHDIVLRQVKSEEHTPPLLPSVLQLSQSLIQLTSTTAGPFPLCPSSPTASAFPICPTSTSLWFSPEVSRLTPPPLPSPRTAFKNRVTSQCGVALKIPVSKTRDVSGGRRMYGSRRVGMRLRVRLDMRAPKGDRSSRGARICI